jgi:hypothetical protein
LITAGCWSSLIEIEAFLINRLTAADFQVAGDGGEFFGIAPDQIKPGAAGGETAGGSFGYRRSGANNQNIAHKQGFRSIRSP